MIMILKAIQFAKQKHHGQVRKGSGEEYITHPVAVSYILASYKKSKKLEEILVAAVAHDLLEDTNTTFIELVQEFSPLVASLVYELTNDPEAIALVGKLEYHKKKLLGISNYGLLIKLADRLHNVSDHPSDKMISDTIVLMEFLKENRKLTKTQLAILVDILIVCNK